MYKSPSMRYRASSIGLTALFFLAVISPVFGIESVRGAGPLDQWLDPPDGYCTANPKGQAADASVYAYQQTALGQVGYLAAMMMLCSELEALRGGRLETLSRYGLIIFPYSDGRMIRLSEWSRSDLLNTAIEESSNIELTEAFRESKRDAERGGYQLDMEDPRYLGVLVKDNNAVYFGIDDPKGAAKPHGIGSAVTATTLLRNHVVNVTFYSNSSGEEEISSLLEIQRPFVDRLVREYPSSFIDIDRFGFIGQVDWSRVLIGVMIGGLIGAIIGIVRRRVI